MHAKSLRWRRTSTRNWTRCSAWSANSWRPTRSCRRNSSATTRSQTSASPCAAFGRDCVAATTPPEEKMPASLPRALPDWTMAFFGTGFFSLFLLSMYEYLPLSESLTMWIFSFYIAGFFCLFFVFGWASSWRCTNGMCGQLFVFFLGFFYSVSGDFLNRLPFIILG